MKRKLEFLPPIGMRIVKSALGVFLGFIIYLLRGRNGTPFYTALSVLWCMQPYVSDSKEKAFQRTIGTFIGAFYGTIMILLEYYFVSFQHEFVRYTLISLLIIPVIYTTIVLNKKNASYFSCVVFLSIVVNHLEDANPYFFVFNRVLDTLIGIGLALIINTARIPRKKRKDVLFVSGLDSSESTLTPYSKFELNNMLDDGAKFTIATMRPPAALFTALEGIRINLPVIVMNGAMLYDMKNNKCLKAYEMKHNEVKEFKKFFDERGIHCFINVVMEDSVVIYYGDFNNKVEKDIYDKLRSSPYRNYVKGNVPEGYGSVYIMLVDKNEKMDKLYEELELEGYTKNFKILKYKSDDYDDYSYIKIYNKRASKKNMVKYIKKIVNAKEICCIGDIEDNFINGKDSNKMIKRFKRIYQPYFWENLK